MLLLTALRESGSGPAGWLFCTPTRLGPLGHRRPSVCRSAAGAHSSRDAAASQGQLHCVNFPVGIPSEAQLGPDVERL
jgi:hypothetical protein